jgi:hypothetical protein
VRSGLNSQHPLDLLSLNLRRCNDHYEQWLLQACTPDERPALPDATAALGSLGWAPTGLPSPRLEVRGAAVTGVGRPIVAR